MIVSFQAAAITVIIKVENVNKTYLFERAFPNLKLLFGPLGFA
jgi:hypothetical protein